jgi:hypothetical protein
LQRTSWMLEPFEQAAPGARRTTSEIAIQPEMWRICRRCIGAKFGEAAPRWRF